MNNTGRRRKQKKLGNYCKICHQTIIGSLYKFKSHLFKHDAVKARFNCSYCMKKFFRKDNYKLHISKHLGTYKQKSYTCDYCGRVFVLKNNLIIHLKKIHDENIDTELGRFACSICKVGYCERRLLERHIRKEHFNLKLAEEPPLHTIKSINETWVENVNNKNAVVSMTKVNNNAIVIKRLKIDVKVEETKANLTEFKSEVLDQYCKGICDYCKKEMLKKSLRTHINEVHMDLRKFKCKVCKAKFFRRYQLVIHNCGHVKRPKRRYHLLNLEKNELQPNYKY